MVIDHKKFLNLTQISASLIREVNSFSNTMIRPGDISKLYSDPKVHAYFSHKRTLQEFPGLYNLFNSRGFDMSLANKINTDRFNTNKIFLDNLSDYKSIVCNKPSNTFAGLTQRQLDFLKFRLFKDVYPGMTMDDIRNRAIKPSHDDVMQQQNLSASMGLPTPWLKKRDIVAALSSTLREFYSEDLILQEIFKYPACIFTRSQIRSSGLKVRLVFAVQALQQLIESYFSMYYTTSLPDDSCLVLGKTQLEISSLVSRLSDTYTYPFDYTRWDFFRLPILTMVNFNIFHNLLDHSDYELKFSRAVRNSFITLPSFHPDIEYLPRYLGTVSGSGFTSLDNSMSNWQLFSYLMYDMCINRGLDPYTYSYKIYTSGDDLVVGLQELIETKSLFKNCYRRFGVTLRLEGEVSHPGTNSCYFLGSRWQDGCPYRPEKLLVAMCIFGSGNYPRMSVNELFQSRFFEIFGNTADILRYWERFRIAPKKKLFFFRESYRPFKSGSTTTMRNMAISKNLMQSSKSSFGDSRGFWYKPNLSRKVISSLWATR